MNLSVLVNPRLPLRQETYIMHPSPKYCELPMQHHLIISCSARKSLPSTKERSISSFMKEDINLLAKNWLQLLEQDEDLLSTERLYTGVTFRSLKGLAKKNNFELSVISAGFGLLRKDFHLPGYNATFADNDDKVPTPSTTWWNALISNASNEGKGRTSFEALFKAHPQDKFIISCAKDYLYAIQYDLLKAINELHHPREQLVIISSQLPTSLNKLSEYFLKSNSYYKNNTEFKRFGLAMNDRTLNAIATHLFVEQLSMTQIGFSDIICQLNKQADSVPTSQKVARQKKGKNHTIDFINKKLDEDSTIGVTKMHKCYRNAGYACSDKNFRELFAQVKNSQG